MTQQKRYKLLKDLPDIKAGNIFEYSEEDETYDYTAQNGEACWYKKHYVENNPEWFAPIPEETIQTQEKDNTVVNREYRIDVSGCDDTTTFKVWLTDEEYDLVKGICDKCTATSTYGCMPTMEITNVTEQLQINETLTQ